MKNKFLSILVFLLFGHAQQAFGEVAHVDRNLVAIHQERFCKLLERNKLERKAFVALMAIVGATAIYGFNRWTAPNLPVQEPQPPLVLPTTKADPGMLTQEILERVKMLAHQGALLEKTIRPLPWYKAVPKFVIEQLSVSILFQMIAGPFGKYINVLDTSFDRLLASIYYTPDLKWFFETQHDITTSLQQVVTAAEAVDADDKTLAEDRRVEDEKPLMNMTLSKSYNITSFLQAWDIFVGQLESLLGFMSVTAHELAVVDPKRHEAALSCIEYVICQTGNCADFIALISEHKHSSMVEQVTIYRNEIEKTFVRFAQLEVT